jgi:alpha-amylase
MDDNDMQVPGDSRDCHGTCCVLVLDCDSADTHRGFEVELFTAPPGSSDNMNDYPIRLLLSSYYPLNGGPGNGSYPTSYGPPDGLSSCALCTTECSTCQTDFPYAKAYVANATSYAGPYYTRTHRDLGIVNAMRSWMNLPPIQAVYG